MKHANVDIGRWIEEHVLYKQRISLRWIGGEFNQIVGLDEYCLIVTFDAEVRYG